MINSARKRGLEISLRDVACNYARRVEASFRSKLLKLWVRSMIFRNEIWDISPSKGKFRLSVPFILETSLPNLLLCFGANGVANQKML